MAGPHFQLGAGCCLRDRHCRGGVANYLIGRCESDERNERRAGSTVAMWLSAVLVHPGIDRRFLLLRRAYWPEQGTIDKGAARLHLIQRDLYFQAAERTVPAIRFQYVAHLRWTT